MRYTRIRFAYIFLLLVSVLIVGAVHMRLHTGHITLPPQYYAAYASGVRNPLPHVDHVIIILEENKPQSVISSSTEAPFLHTLTRTSATTQHYYAVTNPSLPNYIAVTSGTTASITNDCNPPGSSCQANVPNVADRLEQAGKTWKEYAESMPTACYGQNSGEYVVRHNPFMYYPDIRLNPARCTAHVVPFTQFGNDLSADATLPAYSFITPNVCNDMHDCSIQTGDAWLAREVPNILHSPAFVSQHSLLIITWDEGDDLDNNTLALFAGSAAKPAYSSPAYYSHYSLLHTIEALWGLPPLTQHDKNAPLMQDMLR